MASMICSAAVRGSAPISSIVLRSFAAAPQALTGLYLSARSFSDDTHDDFKSKANADVSDVASSIQADIEKNNVMVYMKGVPAAPMCGFSNTVCRVLDAYGVEYVSRNVLEDPDLREGIKQFTSWPTIPQIFVKGEFIGGCDILLNMHDSGELRKIFAEDLEKQGK